MSDQNSRLIVVLDYPDMDSALTMAKSLDPALCRVKVGKELFTRAGPQVLEALRSLGFDIFLDLKYHDIPNTVAQAVQAAAEAGVWMVNVHASGGPRMMASARNMLDRFSAELRPLLIAVTVLTSMDQQELNTLGIPGSLEDQVIRLAKLARESGMDGVVCSALEAGKIKQACGSGFVTVTPGIRPAGTAANDQARIMTPSEAVRSGADYLVVGRPITEADNPMKVVKKILAEIASLN
ncbi:MAG: orotidine-5'-phosphate decarboxylase [Pseudohongiellaceae bacterium]